MKLLSLIAVSSIFIASSAFALDLQAARSSGAVKEQPTGYITAVTSSPEVDALVAEVNGKRKAEYERIAKDTGGTAEAVAATAAKELMKK